MNTIRPQTVTLLIVALVFGLVTAYVAKLYLGQKPVVEAQPAPKMATVVVAQTNLPEYARIRDQDVEAVQVPVADVPPEAMVVKARAVGRLVKATILAGHAVRERDLYEVGKVPMLADQLPPGMRAVTLKVDDASTSNGVLQPGSYVDVSLTFESDHPDVEGMATELLMRHLKVLTIGPNPRDQQVQVQGLLPPKQYITVAATPEQANRLTLAQSYGTVSVTLCSSQESEDLAMADTSRHLINKSELLGLPAIPPPLVPTPEVPVRKVVEIYRGTDLQQVVFNEAGELMSTVRAASPAPSTPAPSAATPAKSAGTNVKPAPKDCPTCNKPSKKATFPGATRPTPGEPTPATPQGKTGTNGPVPARFRTYQG